MRIRKRNGEMVEFSPEKIKNAMAKAFAGQKQEIDGEGLTKLLQAVLSRLSQDDVLTVELVQDEVETRLARVLSQIAGAGQVEVLVMEDGCDGVRGVLIVADGADELTVRTELMRAAMTALDVPASSVEVFARNEE